MAPTGLSPQTRVLSADWWMCSLRREVGIERTLVDAAAIFIEVLDAPLTNYFERARFALGAATEEPLGTEGMADLSSGKFVWTVDGEPFIYNDGVHGLLVNPRRGWC